MMRVWVRGGAGVKDRVRGTEVCMCVCVYMCVCAVAYLSVYHHLRYVSIHIPYDTYCSEP